MSDLYNETSPATTAGPDTSREPAPDAGSGQQYETADQAGQGYGEYAETDAQVQARITSQDELPAREDSRQATWGDNPDYYDETDPGSDHDDEADADALLAAENELPTPQESRARTWGDTPDYYDETDLASEYDAESSAADGGDVASPEADRFKALETEHEAAKNKIADLEAELKAAKDEQAARFDRIEQLLASTDRQRADTDTPEHGADQPGATRDPDAKGPLLAENKNRDEVIDAQQAEQAEHPRWRRAVSSENVGAAGTLVGAADTVAQFAMHATPEGVAGLGAMALGLASLGLAKFEKHRKEKA